LLGDTAGVTLSEPVGGYVSIVVPKQDDRRTCRKHVKKALTTLTMPPTMATTRAASPVVDIQAGFFF